MKTIRQSRSRKLVPCEVQETKRTFRIAYLVLPNYDVKQEVEAQGAPAPNEKQSA